MLERYLVIRQLYPEWFRKLSIDDPAITELLQNGYIVPLPQRDDSGRQVIISCAGEKYNVYRQGDSGRQVIISCAGDFGRQVITSCAGEKHNIYRQGD